MALTLLKDGKVKSPTKIVAVRAIIMPVQSCTIEPQGPNDRSRSARSPLGLLLRVLGAAWRIDYS
jgi:hypothetical protein